MKRMAVWIVAAATLGRPALAMPPMPEPAALFNGTNLDGWVHLNGGHFSATNGTIRVTGGRGWLRSARTYGDFILTLEWRGLETNYNSGVFIRAAESGKPWPPGVLQLNTKQTGIGELLAGPAKVIHPAVEPVPAGVWVKFRIQAQGTNLSLAVDGRQVWQFHTLQPPRGYLGLQAEGKAVEFRDLRIVELSPDALP